MTTCRTKRFPRTKICAGDFRHKVRVMRRELQTPTPGTQTARIGFTLIKRKNAALEEVSIARKFDGVNIEDRPTHIWTVRRDSQLTSLEQNNHFIEFRSRYFRVLRAREHEEDNRYLVIQTTERGDQNQQAAEA